MALITLLNLTIGIAAWLVALVFIRCVYNTIYHPLSQIPGSKLAAATQWYEVYFDLCKGNSGQYIHEIDRQHEVYGPIVRINPREVHIRDVSFREHLYSRNRRVDKDPQNAAIFGMPLQLFGTINHEVHRVRRLALNPFFSKASVARLEPFYQRHVRSVCDSVSQAGKNGSTIQLRNAMIAVTIDIISEYAFGGPVGASTSPESWPRWEGMMSGIAEGVPAAKSFPWLVPLMLKMPVRIIKTLSPVFGDYWDYMAMIRSKVRIAIAINQSNTSKPERTNSEHSSSEVDGQPTIYKEILKSSLPPIEKSEERLSQEAIGLIAAGSETTALTIATIMFHVIQQPQTIQMIRDELRTTMPTRYTPAKLTQLEQLPMLSAVVREGLRISTSICGRLPVVLDEAVQYQQYVIPPRTPISMSTRHALMDHGVFAEPNKFEPRRWLELNAAQRALMDKAFVPFSQGPRMCIGLNLAYADIYQNLSCMLARFDFALVDTLRERDVDLCRDCFVSKPTQESKGIRVRIIKEFEEQW